MLTLNELSPCRLSKLRAGEFAVIVDVDAAQPSAKRLVDMGFVRGSRVTMVRPGRPCIVRLGDRCIGLGSDYQEIIRLIPASRPSPCA